MSADTSTPVPAELRQQMLAQAQGAQHGIAEGVNEDIAVGMRLQGRTVGYRYAAKDNACALAEAVHVVTVSNTHFPVSLLP